MTDLVNSCYTVESITQFVQELDVDTAEIIEALPKTDRLALLERENSIRAEDGDPPVETLQAVPDDVLMEYLRDFFTLTDIVPYVLDYREQIYTHHFDGVSLYRIYELSADRITLDPSEYTVKEIDSEGSTSPIGSVTASTLQDARQKAHTQYGSPVEVTRSSSC